MDKDDVRLIAEAAKALAPVVERPVAIVTELLDDALRAIGGPLGRLLGRADDWLYAKQAFARIQVLAQADGLMKDRGIPIETLPDGFLVPYLEAAGNVFDNDVRSLWAELFASAMKSDEAQHPAFIQALRSMTGAEAQLLKEFVDGLVSNVTPVTIYSPVDIDAPAAHLMSLGLLAQTVSPRPRPGAAFVPAAAAEPGTQITNLLRISAFGAAFATAVGLADRGPAKPTE